MNSENKKVNEGGENGNQSQNNPNIKPAKDYDARNLIGAQVKIPYQNKMDNNSFHRT